MSAGEGRMQTICFMAAAAPGGLLSNCPLPVQSIEKPFSARGQRDGKEHISSPCDVRGSAKTETSRLLATPGNGWEMPVHFHLIAQVELTMHLSLLMIKSRLSPTKSVSDEKMKI